MNDDLIYPFHLLKIILWKHDFNQMIYVLWVVWFVNIYIYIYSVRIVRSLDYLKDITKTVSIPKRTFFLMHCCKKNTTPIFLHTYVDVVPSMCLDDHNSSPMIPTTIKIICKVWSQYFTVDQLLHSSIHEFEQHRSMQTHRRLNLEQ